MTNNSETTVDALPSQAYFVHYDESKPLASYFCDVEHDDQLNVLHHHVFCGPNNIPGAWCPNCDKPLLNILDLDTSDPRLELGTALPSSLPLLCCWTCNV